MRDKEFELVLEEGEGYRIEFKENATNIDKEMVAFANASGGRIFVGITDNKKVVGINIDNRLKSQIQDIANNCQPGIQILLEHYNNVLVITVREGEDKPYKCTSGFYTRVGPNSQKLSRNEIVEFFKSEGKIRFDELINLTFDYEKHFDPKKFDKFLRLAGISKVLDDPEILINLGVAEKQEGKIIFNNTGIFFFAKNLADIYFHTAITCALYKGTEKVDVLDRRDFNEDIVSNIDGAINFLKQYIPVRYEMTGEPRRKEIPEIPYDVLREAVINAVAHRDYFEKGTNVMVEIFDDRIEITNFGGLPRGLKPEDFGKRSVLRNPNIANLLHRIGYIEKMGTGINKMRKMIKEAGLPPIQFEFTSFFTVRFERPSSNKKIKAVHDGIIEKANEFINDAVNEAVNEAVKKRLGDELLQIYQNDSMTLNMIKKMFKISRPTAQRDLLLLKNLGVVEFTGAPKTGIYILTSKGKKIFDHFG